MTGMIDEIVARVRQDLDPGLFPDLRRAVLERTDLPAPPSLATALSAPGLSVIAEIKRRSPSRGPIDTALDPSAHAQRYVAGGAAAVSVLTERAFFDGSPEDLQLVAAEVDVPVLRKDFIVHPMQVWEARLWGASAVLLIVAALTDDALHSLLAEAGRLGMEALVEVHDEAELDRALSQGASIVGVNNRDLTTFEVQLETSERLAVALGDEAVKVAESGIWTADDAARMASVGFDAVLVGEALVRSDHPELLIEALRCG